MTVTVKCHTCGRRCRNNMGARARHMIRWHGDDLQKTLMNLVARPEVAMAVGVDLGIVFIKYLMEVE